MDIELQNIVADLIITTVITTIIIITIIVKITTTTIIIIVKDKIWIVTMKTLYNNI